MPRLKYQASRLFNFLTVIILTGLCLLLNSLTQINFHRLELPKNKPEFAATGFSARLYSPTGKLIYSFKAESGNQFPDSSEIRMTNLQLQVYSESTGALTAQVNSKDGWVDTKDSLAFLGESVVMIAANPDPKQVVYIYTRHVRLNGISKKAASSEPITAVQGTSRMSGVGFTADYDKQLITILSQVKATYNVNK